MKKRFITTFCFLFMIQFFLTGCSSNYEDSKATKAEPKSQAYSEPLYDWGNLTGETITMWVKENELNRTYIQKALERYETLTNNDLIIVEIQGNEFENTVAKAFSDTDSEKPDILLSYGGFNIEKYMPDENFYDFKDAPWVNDLTTTSINQTIYNGRVIGLPHWEASISGTLYNKEVFKKYGIEIPKTQSEFMEVCKKLSENGIIPIYLPYSEISMLLYQFPLDTLVENTKTLDGLNNGTLNYSDIEGMRKVIQWYRDMAKNGYFGTNYETNNWNGMSSAMESEKYGMMLCWDTWLFTDYEGDPSKFGLMPAFMGIPDNGVFEGPNLALFIVNQKGQNVDVAIEFITFLADPYNYNIAFDGIYTAPVFKRQVVSISTPQYVEAERLIEKHFRNSTAWLRIRGFSQMDASFIQKYMSEEPNYTIEDCLNDMDAARLERIGE